MCDGLTGPFLLWTARLWRIWELSGHVEAALSWQSKAPVQEGRVGPSQNTQPLKVRKCTSGGPCKDLISVVSSGGLPTAHHQRSWAKAKNTVTPDGTVGKRQNWASDASQSLVLSPVCVALDET